LSRRGNKPPKLAAVNLISSVFGIAQFMRNMEIQRKHQRSVSGAVAAEGVPLSARALDGSSASPRRD
jgi:hypothetical protein